MNAVNWKHILVAGSCRGVAAYLFVDSGSAVSIVSTSFVKGLGVESGIRPCGMTLKSFSQDTIQIRGEIELQVIVAGNRFVHTFVVTDLLDTEFLIGDDFLRSNRVTLDYNKCRLMLNNGDSVPFTEKPENVKQQIKVRCSKVTVIPPNTIQYIRGKLQAKGVNFKGLIEPQYRQGVGDTGILFAHAVVHSEKRLVPIKCVNATDEPITIHKNKIIALLKPVGDQEFIHGVQRSRGHEVRVRGTSIDDQTQERRSGAGSIEGEKWTESELFERLGLDEIEVTMSDAEKDRLKKIIWRFRDCFSHDEFDIGCCNMYEAKIKMKEGESPSWTYPIPTPYKLQPEMDRQIDQMVRAGIAEPLKGPSDFNHPIFLVKKNTAPESWRLVADLRGANKVCMDEKYPLPNLDHVLDTIGSDSIYSSFDLSKSFWQIPYSEDSKKVTAFMHRGRSYCWARLIMGHKNSSSIFSKVMWKLLATVPIEQLIFFIDDLFLSSKTVSEHLDRLEILLLRLVQANLKLTPKKCMLLREKVTFVGVSISEDGVQITDDRVKDLLALPVPTTVKRVQEVLGALNYVRKWIPRYSVIAKPLHRLTAKETKFEWTSECQDAFEELKRAVAESTMLAIPDTEDPFQSYHLTVDASKHGYGATLSQEIVRDGKRERRIVAFYSKAVPPYKRERSQTQLEFDAMVIAIDHWKMYLRNTRFKVITDCKSLLSASDTLFSKSDPALIRKCQELSNYSFDIVHIEGKENTLCDFLSRFPFRRKFVEASCQTEIDVGERARGEECTRSVGIDTVARDHNASDVSELSGNLTRNINAPDVSTLADILTRNINASVVNVLTDILTRNINAPDVSTLSDILTRNINAPDVSNLSDILTRNINASDVSILSDNLKRDINASDVSESSSNLTRDHNASDVMITSNVDNISSESSNGSEIVIGDGAQGWKDEPLRKQSNEEMKIGDNEDHKLTERGQEEKSDLQILFEDNHGGNVMMVKLKEENVPVCICSIDVMPRLQKKQGNSKQVTFAVPDTETDKQCLPELERIKTEQNKDPILRVVKQWVEDGARGTIQVNRVPDKLITYWTQFSLLKVDESGLLKRKWVSRKEKNSRELIVIPDSCEEEIMKLFHDNITNCHPGINTCVEKCREYFYWPKMEQDFKMYIKACIRCGEMKQPKAYLKAPLKHLFFHHFNDAIVIDHIVPTANQRTPRGYRYILTISDAWSNYLVAVPVRSQTAKENVAAIMKNWILKFGMCRELIVDNHPGFRAEFFREVWEHFECKKTHGTSYKASSTARAENNNKRTNRALRACIPRGREHCWDIYLDKSTFALNCLKNRRTGYSAHKMVFGREVNVPLNLMLDDRDKHQPDTRNTAAREAYELHREMKRIIRRVRESADVDFMYAQRQHDRNLHGPYFKENDFCFVLVQCPKHKFAPRFRGPCRVKKVLNDHLYVVEYGPGLEKVTNISKMKHYEMNRFSEKRVLTRENSSGPAEPERKDPVRGDSDDSESSSDEELEMHEKVERRDSVVRESTLISQKLKIPDKPQSQESSVPSGTGSPDITIQPDPQTPARFNTPIHISSPIQETESSFGSFYTPGWSRGVEEPTSGRDDSLSPVILGESNSTLAYSPDEQSTPVASGGRSLRNRAQLKKPDYYRPVSRISVVLKVVKEGLLGF